MPNFYTRAQDDGVSRRERRRNLQAFAQHRLQPPGQFTGRAAGNSRWVGNDDVVRDRPVLLCHLQGQGGITQPALLPGLPPDTRSQAEDTQDQKADRTTNAHPSYLKINPWPSTLESSLVPRKVPLFAIAQFASEARTFSVPTITPRSRCTLIPWPST